MNPGDQLSTHITGVIAHGQNTFTTYLDLNQYPHDSNLTMNVILRTLKKISDSMVCINTHECCIALVCKGYSLAEVCLVKNYFVNEMTMFIPSMK